jgi:hypothetical protein
MKTVKVLKTKKGEIVVGFAKYGHFYRVIRMIKGRPAVDSVKLHENSITVVREIPVINGTFSTNQYVFYADTGKIKCRTVKKVEVEVKRVAEPATTYDTKDVVYIVMYNCAFYIWYNTNSFGLAQLIDTTGKKYSDSGIPMPDKLQVMKTIETISFNGCRYFSANLTIDGKKEMKVISAETGKIIKHTKIVSMFK